MLKYMIPQALLNYVCLLYLNQWDYLLMASKLKTISMFWVLILFLLNTVESVGQVLTLYDFYTLSRFIKIPLAIRSNKTLQLEFWISKKWFLFVFLWRDTYKEIQFSIHRSIPVPRILQKKSLSLCISSWFTSKILNWKCKFG